MTDDPTAATPPTSETPSSNLSSSGGAASIAPSAPPPTPEVLKSAYNAFKKRWKLTRLDYESRIGRGPLSAGSRSAIVGIEPPKEFPRAVWEELVKQGRIKQAGKGLFAMP